MSLSGLSVPEYHTSSHKSCNAEWVGQLGVTNEYPGACDTVRERGTRRSLERDQKRPLVLAATD